MTALDLSTLIGSRVPENMAHRVHITRRKVFFVFIFLGFCMSCEKDREVIREQPVFDVILVMGQSNTHQGYGFDSILDFPCPDIKQFGRFGENNYRIIQAAEPLDHWSKLEHHIGFVLPFAKKYANEYLKSGHEVLIIPCGMGSTGFGQHSWNPGDSLYNDAVARTNYVLSHYNSRLIAILWHQGESDVGNPLFQNCLDSMITILKKDIVGENERIPFILGGLVPYWTDQDSSRIALNRIISATVFRISRTGYADPRQPFVIDKPDNDFIPVHYDANGQREMGIRYFNEFRILTDMRREVSPPPAQYKPRPGDIAAQ